MRIWLTTVGEPLPIDDSNPRLLRTGQFAQWLSEHGHEVVFFTGTMDHYARRLRSEDSTSYQINPNFTIQTLKGRLYRKSISLNRILNHRDVAKSFKGCAPILQKPDVILSSFPTLELCQEVLNYAETRRIPVAIDTRDLWPDIFEELLPKPLVPFSKFIFGSFKTSVRDVYSRASALSGITESTLQWGLEMAQRKARETDFWFPFSYAELPFRNEHPKNELTLCFLGTLSHRSNLEMIISAMRIISNSGKSIRLDICGTGEAAGKLNELAKGLSNVKFHGWLDQSQLADVLHHADFGVLPYNRDDFHKSLPNKFVEYLAAGRPVLSCTEGEVKSFLERTTAGIWAEPTAEAIAKALIEFRLEDLPHLKVTAKSVFNREFSKDAVFSKAASALERIVFANHETQHNDISA